MRMRQPFILRTMAVVVLAAAAAGSLLIPSAGAALSHQARATAPCAKGDTSGSCRIEHGHVIIIFRVCNNKPCPPIIIVIKKDANHPYGVDIVVPSTGGGVPSKQSHPQADVFSVLIPTATQGKSIQPGWSVDVSEDPSGVFTLRVYDEKGRKVAVWSPGLKLVRPAGFKYLQIMTRAGWVRVDYNRVQTPGLYRWVKS